MNHIGIEHKHKIETDKQKTMPSDDDNRHHFFKKKQCSNITPIVQFVFFLILSCVLFSQRVLQSFCSFKTQI